MIKTNIIDGLINVDNRIRLQTLFITFSDVAIFYSWLLLQNWFTSGSHLNTGKHSDLCSYWKKNWSFYPFLITSRYCVYISWRYIVTNALKEHSLYLKSNFTNYWLTSMILFLIKFTVNSSTSVFVEWSISAKNECIFLTTLIQCLMHV